VQAAARGWKLRRSFDDALAHHLTVDYGALRPEPWRASCSRRS